jgi:hypothetical protein
MRIVTHQPIFLPWPGFFAKAIVADYMVLLDGVQFPRGRGWMNRNRLKSDTGELWLTVPVLKKGRGLQRISDVEILNENRWQKKHLKSITQNYVHSPYFEKYYPMVELIYQKSYKKLIELNLELIKFSWDALSIKTKLMLQSELGVSGRGTELLINICRQFDNAIYLAFPAIKNHVDVYMMIKSGIQVNFIHYVPPVYPQLWGDFIHNLSTLDMLLNCGTECTKIITKSTGLMDVSP